MGFETKKSYFAYFKQKNIDTLVLIIYEIFMKPQKPDLLF